MPYYPREQIKADRDRFYESDEGQRFLRTRPGGPTVSTPSDESGFFDLPDEDVCADPQHSPPMHLVIPAGKGYRHVCPSCGIRCVVRGQVLRFGQPTITSAESWDQGVVVTTWNAPADTGGAR